MKSTGLQSVVLTKSKKSDTPSKIIKYLNGSVGLRTVQRWCKMIKEKSTARTKTNLCKVKARLNRKKVASEHLPERFRL